MVYLTDVYGVTALQVGWITFAFTLPFIIFSFISNKVLKSVPRRVTQSFATYLCALSVLLRSNAKALGLDHDIAAVLSGMAVGGAAAGLLNTTTVPESIDSFVAENNHIHGVNPYLDDKMADAFSTLNTFQRNFMVIAATMTGAFVYQFTGYPMTHLIFASLFLIHAILNSFLNCGCNTWKEREDELAKLEELASYNPTNRKDESFRRQRLSSKSDMAAYQSC